MREIKFRAWNDGEMIYEKDILHLNKEDNLILRLAKIWSNIRNDSKIMQFTGFRDKNGKEIYEGDILQLNSEYRGDGEIPFGVEWHNGSFVSFSLDKVRRNNNIGRSALAGYDTDNMLVIGNIYEDQQDTG